MPARKTGRGGARQSPEPGLAISHHPCAIANPCCWRQCIPQSDRRTGNHPNRVRQVATISPVAIANPAPGDNAARKRAGRRLQAGQRLRHRRPRGESPTPPCEQCGARRAENQASPQAGWRVATISPVAIRKPRAWRRNAYAKRVENRRIWRPGRLPPWRSQSPRAWRQYGRKTGRGGTTKSPQAGAAGRIGPVAIRKPRLATMRPAKRAEEGSAITQSQVQRVATEDR